MVCKYQMIHNQVIPKLHLHVVSSCALHQYDLNGSATSILHYHYQLCIFWHQVAFVWALSTDSQILAHPKLESQTNTRISILAFKNRLWKFNYADAQSGSSEFADSRDSRAVTYPGSRIDRVVPVITLEMPLPTPVSPNAMFFSTSFFPSQQNKDGGSPVASPPLVFRAPLLL